MSNVDNEYRLGTTNPVMVIELSVTTWCNYTCAYCVTSVQQRREQAIHAFDKHDVATWIAAFERIPYQFALLCRGGEPFLDHQNFSRFLAGVGPLTTGYLRVDTNGSWSPDRYAAVPADIRRKTQLNVSFHPTQIALEPFASRLARIVDAGWSVGMVNYVMQADQADDFERVREYFRERHGIFVNPNPDAYKPMPTKFLPVIDNERKTGAPTLGKACFFPSIAYWVAPDGTAARACRVTRGRSQLDFIRESDQLEPLPTPVRCPQHVCLCLDRYAFLEELPTRGRKLDLLAEYVSAAT